MFDKKPYVVPQRAVNALFGKPEVDAKVNQIAEFVRDFMDVEAVFLDIDAARGELASVAAFEGNSWHHLSADVNREDTANDNRRPGNGGGSVAA